MKSKNHNHKTCVDNVNEVLASHGVELDTMIRISNGEHLVRLQTRKRHDAKRGTKLPALFPQFCPFCGGPQS